MDNDWDQKGLPIQIQQIIQTNGSFGVTLSDEMLAHLNVIEGESVQIEMKEHKLVIRKIIPPESPETYTGSYLQSLQETNESYDAQLKTEK